MNSRRKLLVALGVGTLVAPFGGFAQQQGKVWRVGYSCRPQAPTKGVLQVVNAQMLETPTDVPMPDASAAATDKGVSPAQGLPRAETRRPAKCASAQSKTGPAAILILLSTEGL